MINFVFNGVCVLGDAITEASPGANIQLLSFAEENQKVKEAFELEFGKYDSLNFAIPESVKNSAKKGLELYKKNGNGGTPQALATGRHLANNDKASPEKVRHIAKTHNSTKFTNMRKYPPSDNYIQFMLYGAEAGKDWSQNLNDKLEKLDNQHLSYFGEEVVENKENKEGKNKSMAKYFVAKEDIGTKDAIKIDKSKEGLSDKSWGDVDKSAMIKTLFAASNWKTAIQACYMQLLAGWEDGTEGSCKYPVMCIVNGTLVYNKGGLSSALGYAKKNNEDAVVSKINGIYKKMGLDQTVNNSADDIDPEDDEYDPDTMIGDYDPDPNDNEEEEICIVVENATDNKNKEDKKNMADTPEKEEMAKEAPETKETGTEEMAKNTPNENGKN